MRSSGDRRSNISYAIAPFGAGRRHGIPIDRGECATAERVDKLQRNDLTLARIRLVDCMYY